MEQFVINATTRTESGKKYAKKIRAQGKIPAVAYNEKGESFMLKLMPMNFQKHGDQLQKLHLSF